MVADGHITEALAMLTYPSIVSKDSVRIALTIVALNDLTVLSCDIQIVYLTTKFREKIWTRAGPEFGSDQGKMMIITGFIWVKVNRSGVQSTPCRGTLWPKLPPIKGWS